MIRPLQVEDGDSVPPVFRLVGFGPLPVLAMLTLLVLVACAPPLKDPWGMTVSRGERPVERALPDSLQADLGILPRTPGAMPFSMRLYADLAQHGQPHELSERRYRLDVFGFPSLIAASWLWKNDAWVLVRHDQRTVRRGTGAVLAPDDVGVSLPDVHAVLGFLWGNPLPGFPGADSLTPADAFDSAAGDAATGVVRWTYRDEPWEARFDTATGLCREVRSPATTLRYRKHRLRNGIVVPDEAEVFVGGESLVILNVRDWVASPPWKKSPFELVVPAGYSTR